MSIKIRYAEQKPVPEGIYVARLDGLEPVTNQFGESIKWVFTIQSPTEYVGNQVTGLSSTKASPKSKMYAWLQAFGVVLNPDDTFDIETLLGRTCRIRTKNRQKTTIVNNQEHTAIFSNVDAVAAYIPPTNSPVQSPSQPVQNKQATSVNTQPFPPQTNTNLQPNPPQQGNTIQPDQLKADEQFDF
jgi:hypothetical protein